MRLKRKIYRSLMTAVFLTVVFSSEGSGEDTGLREKTEKIEREMITDGNYTEAVKKLNSLLETYPDNPRIHMDLGTAYYGLMRYSDAYEYFKRAEEMGVDWQYEDALEYAISGMEKNKETLRAMEEAYPLLEKGEGPVVTDLREKVATWHFVVLTSLLEEKYYYASVVMPHIIWLKENVADFPGLDKFSADVYYSAMFYDKAIEGYKKAIEDDPQDARLVRTLAECHVAIGDFDNAQEYYDRAIELYKDLGLKDSAGEIRRLRKVRMALPKKYKDISDLMEADRLDEAEETCRKRISLNPGDYAAITQLGNIYWLKGNKRAAIKLFRKVIKRVPDYPITHLYLGRAYILERKPEKGFAEFDLFREKMELLPKMDKDTKEFYIEALYYISGIYLDHDEYDEAMDGYRKIIELGPDEQHAHYLLGVCYYDYKHNRSRAYEELNKVIDIEPVSSMADMARLAIDRMRKYPDRRFEISPRFGSTLGEYQKMVIGELKMRATPAISGRRRREK